MPQYAIDRRDIDFVLYEQLGIEKLFKFPKYHDHSRELYDAVLEQAEKFAREVLFPTNAKGDREGCTWSPEGVRTPSGFKAAYEAFRAGDWLSIGADPEFGGQGLPYAITTAVMEMFTAANAAFVMYPGLAIAAANLLAKFGTKWMKETVVPRLYRGEWGGTMALTEPQAGSAVGDLTTRAVPNGDHYLIEGNKIFISCAEQDLTDNIIHLVLARIPGDPPGTKGISIFLVPKVDFDRETGELRRRNDVKCTGIEHKMGINGSATCSLALGENGACKGYLIGEPRQGMKIMFTMMNEARIACGLQGEAIAGIAYQNALAYAKERVQGYDPEQWDAPNPERVRIVRHPDVRRMLLDMKATSEGLRALLLFAAFHVDCAHAHPDENVRRDSAALIELLTPICKAYASDQAFRVTETAIQVLGGYGYIKEYGVEQYCRDAKIASIYEGTNGIQALDLLGRKLPMRGGQVFMGYLATLGSFIESAPQDPELGPCYRALASARDRLGEVAMKFMMMGQGGDRLYPMLSATPFLELFGTIAVGHLLLDQAQIAHPKLQAILERCEADTPEEQHAVCRDDPEAHFYSGKVAAAKFWCARKLPFVHAIGKGILSEDRSPLAAIF